MRKSARSWCHKVSIFNVSRVTRYENSELTQQDGAEKEDSKMLVCDKRDSAITYVLCRDLHLKSPWMFYGLLQKDLFKGNWSLAKTYFRQNYCHTCHTRFAVFFPLPSFCVSWLIVNHASRCYARSRITLIMVTSRVKENPLPPCFTWLHAPRRFHIVGLRE